MIFFTDGFLPTSVQFSDRIVVTRDKKFLTACDTRKFFDEREVAYFEK